MVDKSYEKSHKDIIVNAFDTFTSKDKKSEPR